MKISTKILFTLLLLFFAGLFVSNMTIKKEYERADKGDPYWNFSRILEKPFHHISLEGCNLTTIAFEQNPKFSLRVFKQWDGYLKPGAMEYRVTGDTLYLKMDSSIETVIYNKRWMAGTTLIRVFAPYLISVSGNNSKFEMFKASQKSLSVQLKGKSGFELESMIRDFDSLKINQNDSSEVVFEMSPDARGSESFHVKKVSASIHGYSLLDLGHAQIDSLHLDIADSSGILLSGGTLKKR